MPLNPFANWAGKRSQVAAAIAWLDPSVITRERSIKLDIDTDRGPSYGNTLTWDDDLAPALKLNHVHAQ